MCQETLCCREILRKIKLYKFWHTWTSGQSKVSTSANFHCNWSVREKYLQKHFFFCIIRLCQPRFGPQQKWRSKRESDPRTTDSRAALTHIRAFVSLDCSQRFPLVEHPPSFCDSLERLRVWDWSASLVVLWWWPSSLLAQMASFSLCSHTVREEKERTKFECLGL